METQSAGAPAAPLFPVTVLVDPNPGRTHRQWIHRPGEPHVPGVLSPCPSPSLIGNKRCMHPPLWAPWRARPAHFPRACSFASLASAGDSCTPPPAPTAALRQEPGSPSGPHLACSPLPSSGHRFAHFLLTSETQVRTSIRDGGQSHRPEDRALALHTADLGLIPSTSSGPLSTSKVNS